MRDGLFENPQKTSRRLRFMAVLFVSIGLIIFFYSPSGIALTALFLPKGSNVSFILYILSFLLLFYWYYFGVSRLISARPLILRRHPGTIFLLAIALAVIGFLIS
jgi:hypothetical protein